MKESNDLSRFVPEQEKSGLLVLGPGSLDLFYAGTKTVNLPSKIVDNPRLLEQASQRRRIFEELNIFFKKIPDVSKDVNEAIEKRIVNQGEVDRIYTDLTKFLETDQNNARLILYLPFEILPNDQQKARSLAAEEFVEAYKSAWFWLLDESDVRASFVDGDVLEPGLGQPLRVRKAGHLAAELIERKIFQVAEMITIVEQTTDQELILNLTEGLAVAKDKGLVAENEWNKIVQHSNREILANRKKVRAEILPENYLTLDQISESLKKDLNRVESKYASGSPFVKDWSEGRIRWEKKVARGKVLNSMAAKVAKEATREQFHFEKIKHLVQNNNLNESVAPVGLIALFSAVETISEQSSKNAEKIANEFQNTIETCWKIQDPDLDNVIISGLSHWQKRGIVGKDYLLSFGIRLPDFSLAMPIDLEEQLPREFKPLIEAAKKIKTDPELSEFFYPSFLLFGSRIKGYSLGSDVDAGMFVRSGVSFEKREEILKLLHRKIPELTNLDKMAEFWISEKNGRFGLKTPPKEIFTVAGSHQINFFFGGIWIAADNEMKGIYSGIIGNYLNLNVFGEQKDDARAHLLRRLEMDTLQYRLLQKGYRIYYPNLRSQGTEHCELIDWESDFWDPGFRRIASLQFLAKVFLPDLSSK